MGRKKHTEHVNHERWLVSWADLLTLLFAFFVVMFASSVSDKKKAAKMSAAMQTAFQQPGIFDAHTKIPPLDTEAGTTNAAPKPIELPIEANDAGSDSDREAAGKIAESIPQAVQQNVVKIRSTDEGTTLSLDSAGFFDSGSAEVKASAVPLLMKIAAALPPQPLRVEGHTDNQPIRTARFRSNWELSTARAAAIAEVLMRYSIVSPANFALAGYGEFRPIASNMTEAGRAENRRVDIVLLRGKPPRPTATPPTVKPRSVVASEALAMSLAGGSATSRTASSR